MKKEFKWELMPGALGGYWEVQYKNVHISIEPRPHYCDRGRWVAKISATEMWLDEADCWPRYYFDLERAKLECEAFMKLRAGKKEVSSNEGQQCI
jgi:hypothetical protein